MLLLHLNPPPPHTHTHTHIQTAWYLKILSQDCYTLAPMCVCVVEEVCLPWQGVASSTVATQIRARDRHIGTQVNTYMYVLEKQQTVKGLFKFTEAVPEASLGVRTRTMGRRLLASQSVSQSVSQ